MVRVASERREANRSRDLAQHKTTADQSFNNIIICSPHHCQVLKLNSDAKCSLQTTSIEQLVNKSTRVYKMTTSGVNYITNHDGDDDNDDDYPLNQCQQPISSMPQANRKVRSKVASRRRYERAVDKMRQSSTGGARYLALSLLVLLLLLILLANAGIHSVNCDTSTTHKHDNSQTTSSSSLNKHKEKLLTSLSDNIERQHLRLVSPSIRSLVLARPSKFDSNSDELHHEHEPRDFKALLANSQKRSSSRPTTMDDILRQHQQNGAGNHLPVHSSPPPPVAGSTKTIKHSKADSDLRQIMMMHEQQPQVAPAKPQAGQHHPRLITSSMRIPSNLTTKSAAALLSSFSLGEPKLLSNVISHLAAAPAKSSLLLSDAARKVIGSKTNTTGASSTFSPRAIAKTHLAGSLLGLGQMLFAPPSGGGIKSAKYKTPSSSSKLAGPVQLANIVGGADGQSSDVISDAINQPQSFNLRDKFQSPSGDLDTAATSESGATSSSAPSNKISATRTPQSTGSGGSWIKNGASQLAQSYFQDSFRDLLTLSQLPILSGPPVSTAPSDLEPGGKRWLANRVANQQIRGNRTQTIDDLLRYAYILGSGVRRKRDPLKALGSSQPSSTSLALVSQSAGANRRPFFNMMRIPNLLQASSSSSSSSTSLPANLIQRLPIASLNALLANRKIKPRGVMWDMATDPSLAVTVFHLLERASVALPLGFLLMPFVHMIRNPLNGFNLGRIIPARASHRSVDYEELAKRLDMMDKILSRALRSTHRESTFLRR